MGKTCNMPPITDDEVIDAAAAEKTEDTTDAKAAEPEAKEEAVEEKKEEDITIDMRANYSMKNQNPNYGEFLSTMSTSTTNIKNQNEELFSTTLQNTKVSQMIPYLYCSPLPFKILIEFVDDEITVFWA